MRLEQYVLMPSRCGTPAIEGEIRQRDHTANPGGTQQRAAAACMALAAPSAAAPRMQWWPHTGSIAAPSPTAAASGNAPAGPAARPTACARRFPAPAGHTATMQQRGSEPGSLRRSCSCPQCAVLVPAALPLMCCLQVHCSHTRHAASPAGGAQPPRQPTVQRRHDGWRQPCAFALPFARRLRPQRSTHLQAEELGLLVLGALEDGVHARPGLGVLLELLEHRFGGLALRQRAGQRAASGSVVGSLQRNCYRHAGLAAGPAAGLVGKQVARPRHRTLPRAAGGGSGGGQLRAGCRPAAGFQTDL